MAIASKDLARAEPYKRRHFTEQHPKKEVITALLWAAVPPSSAQRVCESGPRAGVPLSCWAVSWEDLVCLQPLATQHRDPAHRGFREGGE